MNNDFQKSGKKLFTAVTLHFSQSQTFLRGRHVIILPQCSICSLRFSPNIFTGFRQAKACQQETSSLFLLLLHTTLLPSLFCCLLCYAIPCYAVTCYGCTRRDLLFCEKQQPVYLCVINSGTQSNFGWMHPEGSTILWEII